MKISQNCLDLIKKWEGFRDTAYLDPVGIPTIGYGTIRYPSGKKVQIGDVLSEQEAEAFLHLECEKTAKIVSELVNVPLNQNQFDALVSFCYNVGVGAFQESTLRKKLNAGDNLEAAQEFDNWVFATENGVKRKLEGLVNRRRDEKTLFQKNDNLGTPLELGESLQDSVNWLEAYREGKNNIIVAWNGEKAVEILTLENSNKEDLIEVLQQYQNAQNIHIAPAGKAVPSGERIVIASKGKSFTQLFNPPTLERALLMRGMADTEATGDDIKELQRRLQDLGFYKGDIDGIFSLKTDEAVRDFQEDYFGLSEADGKVGPKTWAKLWGESAPIPVDNTTISEPGKHYLKLTKTNRKDAFGCFILNLDYFKDGQFKDRLEVCCGQAKRQAFRSGVESQAGSQEPLPEGKWFIHDILWAGGKDNYNGAVFSIAGNGIGPVTVKLDYKGPGTTRRSAIEIHIDWNRRTSPGTVGCIGIYSIADYKRFVSWLRETDPRDLYVDWGLGTCPKP